MHRSIIDQIASDPNIDPAFKRGCAMLKESAEKPALDDEYARAVEAQKRIGEVLCRATAPTRFAAEWNEIIDLLDQAYHKARTLAEKIAAMEEG